MDIRLKRPLKKVTGKIAMFAATILLAWIIFGKFALVLLLLGAFKIRLF